MANRFISILDNIGHLFKVGAKKAVAVETRLLPIEMAVASGIELVDPPLGATIMEIINVIGKVEQVATAVGAAQGTGVAKLAVALPDVEQLILSLPIFKGKQIGDLTKYNEGLIGVTDGFAKLLNAYHAGVPVPVETVPPVTAEPVPAVPLVVANVGKA